jgi:predicted ATPase/DNA-binding CsgD family transcriptional regulator
MAEVKRLLKNTRLLTLTGPGGCGKTRLALRVANDLVEEFEDEVWLVELASLSDPALVPQAVASVLGVREQPSRPLTEILLDHLKPKELLLVLDNCEHLVASCAALADTLLRSCPKLIILATSREILGVSGEVCWPVPPLSLPGPRAGTPRPKELARFGAVRLFVKRAAAVLPGFELTPRNATAVLSVCERLDGMPLAIELAAARVRVLSPGEILERLDDRFLLLSAGGRAAEARHRTLRATMDWSYGLLSKKEQVLFRRLSVFANGFSLEAVEEVCSGQGIEREEVLELLSRLVNQSLVAVRESGGQTHYRLLETIQRYAEEKLSALAEETAIRDRHATYFFSLGRAAEHVLLRPEQAYYLRQLEAEHDNLRAALGWLKERGETERALQMGGALSRYWWTAGHFAEGRSQLSALLELPGAKERTPQRARVLYELGLIVSRSGEYAGEDEAEARRYLEEARRYLAESLSICKDLGDEPGTAAALRELGRAIIQAQEGPGTEGWAKAFSLLEESLKLGRKLGDERGLALTLLYLGLLKYFGGDYVTARSLLEESLGLFRKLGDELYVGADLVFLSRVATDERNYAAARDLLKEALETLPLARYRWFYPRVLETFAGLAATQGRADEALRLVGAASSLRKKTGFGAGPLWHNDLERHLSAARRALSEEAVTAAFEEGRAVGVERAIEEATYLTLDSTADETSVSIAGLTARETQVLRLVAEGLTDAQIAEKLFLSPRTVNAHLRAIYRKTGANSRAAAVRFALEHGLA